MGSTHNPSPAHALPESSVACAHMPLALNDMHDGFFCQTSMFPQNGVTPRALRSRKRNLWQQHHLVDSHQRAPQATTNPLNPSSLKMGFITGSFVSIVNRD
jgi:hypothetical protein